MSDESIKKLNRIIAMLTHLQSERIVTAQELADRFEVSIRTIYRDIRTLEESGVPVVGEAGQGYSIMEGYRLPPVMFTSEEAGSFITAEKLMQNLTDETLGKNYENAMYKIKSVMRATDKDRLESLENSIEVRPRQQMFNTEVPNALEIVLESIADKKQVLVRYKTQFKEPSDRKIEPVGVFHESGFWYFTGYCTLRNDYRLFRMDRIIRIEKTDQTFSRNHPKLSDLRHSELSMPVTTVRFKTSKKIASYMGTAKYDYGFISEIEEGDDVIMTFETRFLNYGFDRWYMMYADESEILEPQELKESVQRMINRITERIAI